MSVHKSFLIHLDYLFIEDPFCHIIAGFIIAHIYYIPCGLVAVNGVGDDGLALQYLEAYHRVLSSAHGNEGTFVRYIIVERHIFCMTLPVTFRCRICFFQAITIQGQFKSNQFLRLDVLDPVNI